jgi:NAD(P)H-hydrate epimerase
VLSGAIAGLLAGGAEAPAAAVTGVYYHGAAGDLAESCSSGRGVIAGDVARALADVLP